jgi:DNA mismatch repair protein MutS2
MDKRLDLFLEAIEFEKIKAGISTFCLGAPGGIYTQSLKPQTNYSLLSDILALQQDCLNILANDKTLPITHYKGLDEHVGRLHIIGYVLPIESFLIIKSLLKNLESIYSFFNKENEIAFSHLAKFVFQTPIKSHLLKAIEKVLDDKGDVRPDASEELKLIRKKIDRKNAELDQVFRTLLQNYRQKGLLTENEETLRNGRRVFSVPIEFKRRISGIIHDESATGKTVYIEPDELISINNEIFSLHLEERKEIYKILKNLTVEFVEDGEYLTELELLIAKLDSQIAISRFSRQYDGVLPEVMNQPMFKILGAYHPLLVLKNKKTGIPTVSFDLDIHAPNRLVLLSGPNAGGKSITMKAIGLLQVMIQCGISLPVSSNSKMGLFKHFFADIGDKQSIEDDLSTYSSHLQNMANIINHADEFSLVLIDEFGGGTDPKMGGAIAESILSQLNKQKAWGMITTHYSNLKLFAFKEKGVVNAAMHFDKESLKPTYKFQLGKPGSSYAFEIARKSGLSDQLIQYAKKRSSEKDSEVDDLLIDVQSNKQSLDARLIELKEKEKAMNLMMTNLEQARKDLEYRRKKWKMEVKELQAQQNDKETRRLEELLKEIKKNNNQIAIQTLLDTRKRKRKELGEEIVQLKEEVVYAPLQIDVKELKEGSHVKLVGGETYGLIESIQGKNALVQIGDMRAKIALRDLVPIQAPIISNQKKVIHYDIVGQNAQFTAKLDIRGFTKDEAIRMMDDFMDKAALSSATQLEILHGKGNGILRNTVKSKLKEYKFVRSLRHPDNQQGGDGITIAELGIN